MYNYLLIDGHNFAWRAGSVLHLRSQEGKNVSVTFGMLSMVRSLLEEYQPKVVCICWDFKGSEAKETVFPEYKEHRKKIRSGLPDDFYKEIIIQIAELQTMLPYFGVRQLKKEGIEADDLIGLLCSLLEKVLVVTSDRDLLQVVSMGANLFYTPKGEVVTHENFTRFSKVKPELYVYYRSLIGDPGDGIPGLKGFGEVTANRLIEKYGKWEDWFEGNRVRVEVLEGLNKSQKRILQDPETKGILIRNYTLMNIGGLIQDRKNEIVGEFLSQKPVFNEEKIREYFLENQFDSYLARYHAWIHPFRRLVKGQ